ncbi:MAG: hypothetical protein PVI97_20760, partial [Candidatus Thiodiazotropha sp.]
MPTKTEIKIMSGCGSAKLPNSVWCARLKHVFIRYVMTVLLLSCFPLMATADVDIDIRVSGTINSNSDYVSYIAS